MSKNINEVLILIKKEFKVNNVRYRCLCDVSFKLIRSNVIIDKEEKLFLSLLKKNKTNYAKKNWQGVDVTFYWTPGTRTARLAFLNKHIKLTTKTKTKTK